MKFEATKPALAIVVALFSACGGGSGDGPAPPPPNGSAVLSAPTDGRVPWNRSTTIGVVLKDGAGAVVANPTCAAADPATLDVTSDCGSAKGLRLGAHGIVVTGGGVSASVGLAVIPQRHPLATHGVDSSNGSGGYNIVVMPLGGVLAWGANVSAGTLGQGVNSQALEFSALPVAVKDDAGTGALLGVVAASAGDQFALALNEAGEVLSWGYNGQSQLARNGVANGAALPGKVSNAANNGTLAGVVEVSAGSGNAIALTDDGSVLSWGEYPGQGSVVGNGPARYPNSVSDPSGTGALSDVASVSAGWNFGLALANSGKVYAWGWNDLSQTGNSRAGTGPGGPPEVLPKTVKRAADGADIDNIVAISAGYNFALALTGDGRVYAWGGNDSGQLGQNTQNTLPSQAVLVKDAAGTGTLEGITMIAAGGRHALAMDGAGRVYSWGSAANGKLGDGANRPVVNQSLLPISVVDESSTSTLTAAASIAAGYQHSLALKADGTLLMWGAGFRGNLAQGAASSADLAVPTPARDASGAAALSAAPLSSYPNLLRRGR
jgi:alpha-tubulin suppressor-like RCC1 family protein